MGGGVARQVKNQPLLANEFLVEEETDMTQLAMELPESVFSALRLDPQAFAAEMRIASAVQWYGERRLSQAKAAEVAGLSRVAFLDELRRRHVPAIQVDADELDAELGA